jgi:hypothetical protein
MPEIICEQQPVHTFEPIVLKNSKIKAARLKPESGDSQLV